MTMTEQDIGAEKVVMKKLMGGEKRDEDGAKGMTDGHGNVNLVEGKVALDEGDKNDGKVLQEIQNVEEGDVMMLNEVMKENVCPLMMPSGGKQWKRLARNVGMNSTQNTMEQKMSKRKNMEDGMMARALQF
ncbi:uncharacterized protein G2W53_041341 [Senna tora]|uniref:Uncharacterized protein n=1 Tax=Senna tora TaxID=362788 RepID=A0A834SGX4_9FABA|nr:uncharacterized protein G2W53_041341 [Senna tora]